MMKTELKPKKAVVPHALEILQVLNRAVPSMTVAGIERIGTYVSSRLCPTGGFYNRGESPDLYYSLFGLSCAVALDLGLPLHSTAAWLENFKPNELTMLELSSLCKSLVVSSMLLQKDLATKKSNEILTCLQRFRCDDGGYSYEGCGRTFPYAVFLALNIYQDLMLPVPNSEALCAALLRCRRKDGRYANPDSSSSGLLLSTVAALMTIRQLTGEIDEQALNWVVTQRCDNGGFKADPESELPDMLSTAVALFALRVCGVEMHDFRLISRQFVEDHWLENGGFSATLLDETADCEYCYYGLLALGALSDA